MKAGCRFHDAKPQEYQTVCMAFTCPSPHGKHKPCPASQLPGVPDPTYQKMRPLSVSRYRNLQKLEHHTTLCPAAARRSASSCCMLGAPSACICFIPAAIAYWLPALPPPIEPSDRSTALPASLPSLLLTLLPLLLTSDAMIMLFGVLAVNWLGAAVVGGMVPSMAACRCCCSWGVSSLQLETLCGRKSQIAMPRRTAGAPSMMNSHLQPAPTVHIQVHCCDVLHNGNC